MNQLKFTTQQNDQSFVRSQLSIFRFNIKNPKITTCNRLDLETLGILTNYAQNPPKTLHLDPKLDIASHGSSMFHILVKNKYECHFNITSLIVCVISISKVSINMLFFSSRVTIHIKI